METKLSVFCDKVIEAGWLGAAIVAPLFFNCFSERIFEPDKIALLRSTAIVMLLAWAVKVIEARGARQKQEEGAKELRNFLGIPLVVPSLVLAGIHILTTFTSVVPRLSLWGSYLRRQGAYTTFSYIAIFFLVLQGLRTREQLSRLITVTVLTSLPISLYGIMQHHKLDPVPWSAEVAGRVTSSMGNPIFLAAYLIMVVPLTIRGLIEPFSTPPTSRKGGIATLISTGCYTFLLAVQLICIVFTQSRGPLIGLMVGLFFFFLLLAISKGKRGLALMVIVLATQLLLFFVILNLPNTPLASLREMPYIGRMGRVFQTETGTGKQRTLIWQGAINMITADPVRSVIGHGPETMYVAFHPYMLPELVDIGGLGSTADRCHNETFDVLITTGLIGFAAYLLLFGGLFYYGLKWLGLIQNSQQRAIFVALWLMGGFLGLLIPWLMTGSLRFAGVGIPTGIIVSLAVYLVTSLFYPRKGEAERGGNQILLIALISALAAHFVEIQFGIAIAATRTYFWLYAALLVVVALFLEEGVEAIRAPARVLPAKPPSKRRKRRRHKRDEAAVARRQASEGASLWSGSLIPYSLSVGLLLITMGFDFIANRYPLSANGFSVPMLFLLTWLFGGLIAIAEVDEKSVSRKGRLSSLLVYSLVSLGLLFPFLLFHTASLPPVGHPADDTIVAYYLCFFLAMLAIAVVLQRRIALRAPLWQRANWWLYPILVLATVVLILTTNLNVVMADIYYKLGRAYDKAKRWDASIASYRRALTLAPGQDWYYTYLSQAYLAKAEPSLDASQRYAWFEEAQRALERGREINPLNPDHLANLGFLHRIWGEETADPGERAEKLKAALGYYQQATAMRPYNHGRLAESSIIRTYLLLGGAYMSMGHFDQAAAAYVQATEVNSQKALEMALKAVEDSPDDYASHRNLAMLYQCLGHIDDAITKAKKARDLAPEKEGTKLGEWIAWLEAQSE